MLECRNEPARTWVSGTRRSHLGGGSGVVPLMAMLRLAHQNAGQSLAHLVVSAHRLSSSTPTG